MAVVLLGAVVLTGCSAAEPDADRSPTQSTSSASAAPTPYAFEMDCQNAKLGASWTYASYEDVWASGDPVVNCNANIDTVTGTFYSDEQKAALASVDYEQTFSALGFLYARCADLGTNDPVEGYWSSAYAALTLCPDHPDAETIPARVEAGLIQERAESESQAAADAAASQAAADDARFAAERVAGTRLPTGIYRVGDTAQPGRYVSEGTFTNCYWARLDNSGNIIDNYFVNTALRVEVSIAPTDYSFSTEGCGEWVRQN